MRQIITLLTLFVFVSIGTYGQEKKIKMPTRSKLTRAQDMELSFKPKPTICFGSGIAGTNHVPPPRGFYESLTNGRTEATSDIEVTYVGNIPPAARTAFEFAVTIWERILISPVKIRIQATWGATRTNNVLGSASPSDARISSLMPRFPVWYPMPLYEKILGRNVNGENPDIVANFNSETNWYLGTDGRTPRTQLDLVSVVLHELGHGLGFFGLYQIENGQGELGDSGYPFIYDSYVANQAGVFLSDTTRFKNPSTGLATQFTSQKLFFSAPYVTNRNGKLQPQLYSPPTFAANSSIAHLDNALYTGSPDALMTPFSNMGESIQNPGGIVISMFEEMGWILTQIKHTPLTNTDQINQPLNIIANIVSDTTIDLTKFKMSLFYSEDNFRTQRLVEMTGDRNGRYTAQIPAAGGTKTISYYMATKDPNGREIRLPDTGALLPFRVTVAVDNDPPTIAHTSEGFLLDNTDTTLIIAKVTDLLGVDTVYAEYQIDGGATRTLPMVFLGNDGFGGGIYGNILLTRGQLRAGGTLRYRIVSRDVSSKKNQGAMPSANDFYTLNIVAIGQARAAYENNFNQMNITDFATNSFKIEQTSGFADGALNSPHPYSNGKGPNDESDFIALLTTPITVRERDATVKFDEVVLVEPGENGSTFGQQEFYDYVVVEGSADRGKTWRPLANGYDSRDNNTWLTTYNRGIMSGNSTAVGAPNLLRPRTINLLDRFKANDQVLLRFRLYADQSAFGWGWLIDNLQIQNSVVGLADYLVYDGDLKVYPNPNQGTFNLLLSNTKYGDVSVKVYNILGSEIKNFQFNKTDQTLLTELQIGNVPKGLYFLHIKTKEGEAQKKIIIE